MVWIPSPMLGVGKVTAKKPPEYRVFWISFLGPRGGVSEIKVRLKLLGGQSGNLTTNRDAQAVQARAQERGWVTRKVEWWKSGNHGFTGILVYGIKHDDLMKHPKVKPLWNLVEMTQP